MMDSGSHLIQRKIRTNISSLKLHEMTVPPGSPLKRLSTVAHFISTWIGFWRGEGCADAILGICDAKMYGRGGPEIHRLIRKSLTLKMLAVSLCISEFGFGVKSSHLLRSTAFERNIV